MPLDAKGTAMLDVLPVPAYMFDAERQTFVAANKGFLDLLGYSNAELSELDWRSVVVATEIESGERAIEHGSMSKPVRWTFLRKTSELVPVVIVNRKTSFVADDGQVLDVFIALIVNTDDEEPMPASKIYPEPSTEQSA
jgi:PAS domain-containing protein